MEGMNQHLEQGMDGHGMAHAVGGDVMHHQQMLMEHEQMMHMQGMMSGGRKPQSRSASRWLK